MKKIMRALLIMLLCMSIWLNAFQRRNQAVTCESISSQWRAELLYNLGHKHLDWNKNWIPCENLLETK